MSGEELGYLSAGRLVRLYRERRVSPLEVVRAFFDRIERIDPRVNAYVTLDRERALRAARTATRALRPGARLGPLHGVPVAVKDVIDTRGLRTTYGSTLYEKHVPEADAVSVERLRAAGAIVLGKTNTPEFAAGANTFNAVFGATRNPWNPALTCGGSSGGSAVALACGTATLALGSDLGGSLRTPASFCGVVGFRTSPGLVPVHPAVSAWDALYIEGPMARTVGDAALMLSVLAGPDARAPLSYPADVARLVRAVRNPSIRGWKVAYSPDLDGLLPVETEVARVAAEAVPAFRELGARVTRGCPDFSDTHEIVLGTRGLSKVVEHGERLDRHRSVLQPGLVWNIEQGRALTAEAIARAERLRHALWHRVRAFMDDHDLLVLPTSAVLPFPVEQPYPTTIDGRPMADYTQWFFLTYAISLTGLPVISVPAGLTRTGLPVGIQLVGRWHGETDVLRAAAAFEAARPWAAARPPIVQDPPAPA